MSTIKFSGSVDESILNTLGYNLIDTDKSHTLTAGDFLSYGDKEKSVSKNDFKSEKSLEALLKTNDQWSELSVYTQTGAEDFYMTALPKYQGYSGDGLQLSVFHITSNEDADLIKQFRRFGDLKKQYDVPTYGEKYHEKLADRYCDDVPAKVTEACTDQQNLLNRTYTKLLTTYVSFDAAVDTVQDKANKLQERIETHHLSYSDFQELQGDIGSVNDAQFIADADYFMTNLHDLGSFREK